VPEPDHLGLDFGNLSDKVERDKVDWGLGPEGSETTVSRSGRRAGEDRDFGFEDKKANRRAFYLDDVPKVSPVKVAPVKRAVQLSPPKTPVTRRRGGAPARVLEQKRADAVAERKREEEEETRQGAVKSLAGRESSILSRIGDDSMSILEAYGLTGGESKYGPGGFIGITAGDASGAGGYFSPSEHAIRLSQSSYGDPQSRQRVTSHELMHSALENLESSGGLQNISFPQMEDYGRKFGRQGGVYDWGKQEFNKFARTDDPFAFEDWKALKEGDWTLQDFADSLRMDDIGYDELGTYPVGFDWAYSGEDDELGLAARNPGWFGRQFDPRMRTAGFEDAEQGKIDYDNWLAFQREMPEEKHGGARTNWREGYSTPYATYTDPETGVSRNLEPAFSWGSAPWGPASVVDEYGRLGTGLGNWPVGDQHAILAANAASYPVTGDVYDDFYGNLARHNRNVMLNQAHPSSRLNTMMRNDLPMQALQAMESYVQQNPWGETETPEEAMNRVRQYMASIGSTPTEEELATAVAGGGPESKYAWWK